jgi:hypothetical protein
MDALPEPTRTARAAVMYDALTLKSLLKRKLRNIPLYIIPTITASYVLDQSTRVTHISSVPTDIQLPFLFRNRALINRYFGRPIKDEKEQSMDITRAIFFYHIGETYQFQRYHDTSRWNIAFFVALICLPEPFSPSQSSQNSNANVPEAQRITPAARRFMTSYLAAVMERHNTPTTFNKREEFVRLWKNSKWVLFERFAASQKKILKKRMQILNNDWEIELDVALREMGRREYDARVAPLVGCLVPGRRDQGIYREHLIAAANPVSRPYELVDGEMEKGGNELLEALCVPLEDQDQNQQIVYGRGEDAVTPVDFSYAIASLQKVRPFKMLEELMRLFPGA